MSFSSDIKEELSRSVNHEKCCQMAELTGFLITNCAISKENGEFMLKMSTENATAIKRVYNFFKNIYKIIPITNIDKGMNENLYQLKIVDKIDLENFFKNSLISIDVMLRIMIDKKEKINEKECCQRAFLRGIFIGSGSMVNPANRYHLEIVASNMENAMFITALLRELEIKAKIIRRKRDYVIYIKDGESISNFLATIGSNKGTIAFEETRVIKEMRNHVNRISNFENANYDKTLDSSMSQVEDIEIIKKKKKFEKMPDGLKQLARLRLSHKEATLEELGKMLTPNLSRAGVSHRFKKIKEIAKELREKE